VIIYGLIGAVIGGIVLGLFTASFKEDAVLGAMLGAICGAALIIPMLDLITLQIPNAAALLFPAWFQAAKGGGGGIEVTGQRLIFMLGQMLVFVVALIPAAALFAGVFFLVKMLLGMATAIPLALSLGGRNT